MVDPRKVLRKKIGSIKKGEILKICKKNHIIFIGIFGSFVRGDVKEDSDIDLLARFSKRKTLLDLVRIERELSEVLGRKVDLLTEGSISPYLKDIIKNQLQVIYEEKR